MSDATRARIAAAWPDILAGLAAGDLVRDVLARHEVSADMLRAFKAGDPALRAQWDDAREQSADALFDEAVQMSRAQRMIARDETGAPMLDENGKPLTIAVDPALARVRIDTLKWAARIRNPRLYGDKAQLDVNVRTVDLTRIIEAANQRLAAARAVGQVVEGEVIRRGAALALPQHSELADLL